MDKNDLPFLNAFALIRGVGPATLRAIKARFQTFEAAWRARSEDLCDLATEIGAKRCEAIVSHKSAMDPYGAFAKVEKEGIWMIREEDEAYPESLHHIANPPMVLYGAGTPFHANEQHISVVGTRRPTPYGIRACESITTELAISGLTIVSGLAIGIDTITHKSALEVKGRTIAVLATGVNSASVFPPENRTLARRIVDAGGTVVSEYPIGTPAFREQFPARNRIIAGLARGILVVEARERSGALITARFALEQNREVFAIPGPIFSATSSGTNRLIQEGAKLTLSAQDMLEELGMSYTGITRASTTHGLGTEEQILLSFLDNPQTADDIKRELRMETATILSVLSMLELKRLVRDMGNGMYQRIN